MKRFFTLLILSVVLLTGCGETHFLTDRAYRKQVHEDFLLRRELAVGRVEALFSVFEREELTTERREALEFLYAYMPLCDLSEYDGDYFLRQVDGALRARETFAWGKQVPEVLFRHFVLVPRVNNEYLDEARDVFFGELKERIEGLSMYDAALEVNHWCHEKVTYRGTDARTSAPLATVRTSWGRCGEESVFTTAALRAVGIPARQCYTPRWVHTDSNHAWVELWIDGKWHYLGACEPEPELDVAWFDGPVQRAMMTHTTVYGRYDGPEEKNVSTPLYSVINTLQNYAPTRRAAVQVVDAAGLPVAGATVQFKVYNSAELFPIVTLQSDAEGHASIDTGLGDLLIWANVGDTYGYVKSGPDEEQVTLTLNRRAGESFVENYVMLAPAEKPFNELPAEKIAANAVRLIREDSIRNAYMATFPDEAYAARVARETKLPQERVWAWLNTAQGNWQEIEKFIRLTAGHAGQAEFLASLSEKDLRDTPCDYLTDFLPLMNPILSPRIGYELITPWRSYFTTFFAANPSLDSPEAIIRYVSGHVRVSDADNYYDCRQTPRGVHELRVADALSRDIYFVALCRSFGVPARLDPATGKPQYEMAGAWNEVVFGNEGASTAPSVKASMTVYNDPANVVRPAYETHFTIARFEDGDFHTLGLSEYFTADQSFPVTVPVDTGYYRVMTASRANDGSATITAQYLTVARDETPDVTISLPQVEGKLFVKGIVDMNSIIVTDGGEKTTLKKLSAGKGVILCFADPDKEPTKHILQEMPGVGSAIGQWGGGLVFLVPDDKKTGAFDPARFPGQPSQTVWATDAGRELLNATAGALQLPFRNNFPLVVYLTNNGGILFSSEGYRLGILEDVLRTIHLEQQTKK